MEIKKLNMKDAKTAERVVEIQKVSYRVEAEMIGFYEIPPMLEEVEDVMKVEDVFHGCFIDGIMAGVVAYRFEDDFMRISRVIVDPKFFRRGVGSRMMDFVLQQRGGIKEIHIGTGKENIPAVTLYTKKGFQKVKDIELKGGVLYRKFKKIYD